MTGSGTQVTSLEVRVRNSGLAFKIGVWRVGPGPISHIHHQRTSVSFLVPAASSHLPRFAWLQLNTMNGIGSSPPSLFGRKKDEFEDNKDQVQDIIAADAQRESLTRTVTPTQAKSDVTEMPSTPPSVPGGEAGAASANGAATVAESAVEREDEMEVDPREAIQNFDWEELQQRYHQMIQEQTLAEDQLWDEFTRLINVRASTCKSIDIRLGTHTFPVLHYLVRDNPKPRSR